MVPSNTKFIGVLGALVLFMLLSSCGGGGGGSSSGKNSTETPQPGSVSAPSNSSARTRVYVANGGGTISAFTFDSTTGQLTPSGEPLQTGQQPSTIIAHPSGDFAYVAIPFPNTIASGVSTYRIDRATGALSWLSSTGDSLPPTLTDGTVSVAVDSSGRFLYVGDNFAPVLCKTCVLQDPTPPPSISAYRIDAITGLLTPLGTIFVGDQIHQVIARSNILYALTSSGFPALRVYTIDPDTGLLTFNSVTQVPGYYLAVAPSGEFAYVTNHAPGDFTQPGSVSSYKRDPGTGQLTLVGTTPSGIDPGSIVVDPSGTFAYVTSVHEIWAYRINAATGVLSFFGSFLAIGGGTIPGLHFPVSIAVDAAGRFLFVGTTPDLYFGGMAYYIAVLSIDPETSVLRQVGTPVETQPDPISIVTIAAP
jgi:6-phosphogluconolactonase (cycloisomerase 2 family)